MPQHLIAPLPPRGRLAPSPTGHIHLGNAWAFLLAWLAVRSQGGSLLLRLEDIDTVRAKPEFVPPLLDDLRWLGLDWDEGPDVGGPHAPYAQRHRLEHYQAIADSLATRGLLYPCYCTRKELRTLASAPHADHAAPVYPGSCHGLSPEACAAKEREGRRPTLRLHCPDEELAFVDLLQGQLCLSPAAMGDVALRRSDGVWAYQLAVVADDVAMGVTQIVRGMDLLDSTPWQVLLFTLLGASPPEFLHVPLLLDHHGERLAKRHGSLELAALREAGVSPEAVVGWLGHQAGVLEHPRPCTAVELATAFSLERLPQEDIIVPEDITARLLALTKA